jgi:uroporphyrinogen decarboxylase
VAVDWTVSLADARRRVGDRVALQGNLDPLVLLADPAAVRREAQRTLADFGPGPGHVFNLGHGIAPATPPEHVALLVESIHAASRTKGAPGA